MLHHCHASKQASPRCSQLMIGHHVVPVFSLSGGRRVSPRAGVSINHGHQQHALEVQPV